MIKFIKLIITGLIIRMKDDNNFLIIVEPLSNVRLLIIHQNTNINKAIIN